MEVKIPRIDDFKVIVITAPEFRKDEAEVINTLLANGSADYVHIRKPEATIREVKNLIEEIDIRYRHRLRLHGHFSLLEEFNLAGVQINSRCPLPSPLAKTVTKSCHSINELLDHDRYEYVTLSPIYPSISKPGYGAKRKKMVDLGNFAHKNVIALGGVTPEKFAELKAAGFAGGALLGYVWQDAVQ